MSENALAVRNNEMSLKETMTLGQTLAESGFFSDTKSAAQAVVKILAGRELGFGAIASMTGINIIKSQVAIGGNLMAASVKRDPRYDYKVVELSDTRCELAFYQGGAELGRSVFTAQDAERAEIGKMVAPGASRNMLARFPRNMLFNRAMSNGVRWYCPDAFGGSPVYTPEELGAEVDEEGNVIEGQFTTASPKPTTTSQPPQGNGDGAHWIDNAKVRARFWAWTKNTLALTEDEVHEALNVESVKDFTGTMEQAKELIEAWVAGKSEPVEVGGE